MKDLRFDELVASESIPVRQYRISGELRCTCTGFASHGLCKHLRRKVGDLLAPKAKAGWR